MQPSQQCNTTADTSYFDFLWLQVYTDKSKMDGDGYNRMNDSSKPSKPRRRKTKVDPNGSTTVIMDNSLGVDNQAFAMHAFQVTGNKAK